MHHHYHHDYLVNTHVPCVIPGQGLPGCWRDGGRDEEALGDWPCLCSRAPPIKMWGFAEVVWLQDQNGARGPLVFLIKDRECFCKFFLRGDVSPKYNWAMGQHKIKLLEPVRPD